MKPKKLNLDEMWRLYLLLKPAIDGREQEKGFTEEISKLIEVSRPETLLECMRVMYDNQVKFLDALEFTSLFALGLEKNEFYQFVGFIRGLDGSSKR